MKIDTADWITDTHPLYQALAELTTEFPLHPYARRFLYRKMRSDIRNLKMTLKFVSEKLDKYDEVMKQRRAAKKAAKAKASP